MAQVNYAAEESRKLRAATTGLPVTSSENLDENGESVTPVAMSDDSARRFRDTHPDDQFSGSSGMLFEQAMAQTRMAICLTDPYQPDNPIVFANRAFRELTGYDESEIVGRNCRFLQGPDSDPATMARLSDAISREDVVIVEIVNYRKDGSAFWNALHVGPIYDDSGRLVYYFGSQWDVSNLHAARAGEQHAKLMARELSHRMKNMFSVISAIVNGTGRARGIEDAAAEVNSRIRALGRAYDTTLEDATVATFNVHEAIKATLLPYRDKVGVDGPDVRAPFGVISAISLILHELAANAGKYGAWSLPDGKVSLSWSSVGPNIRMQWNEFGGPAITETEPDAGSGTMITDRLLRAAGGQIERIWRPEGLEAIITLPVTDGVNTGNG